MQDAGHLEQGGTNIEPQVVIWRGLNAAQAAVHAQQLPHAGDAIGRAAVLAGKAVVLRCRGDEVPHASQSDILRQIQSSRIWN